MSFLDNLTKEDIQHGTFPLKEVLKHSFYYPSCAFDGGIVKDCNTLGRKFNIVSFIYCDYAAGEGAFREQENTFLGYHILENRSLRQSELIPNGWNPKLPPNFRMQNYQIYKDEWKPFINWTVYERDENRGNEHGPFRFSLLYLGGEAVATYQALYWTNKTHPKALAIIQPGTAFGLNWADFRYEDGPLAWVVNNNRFGTPDIIYYGGYGRDYENMEWEGFAEERIISPYYHNNGGEVRIWSKKQV